MKNKNATALVEALQIVDKYLQPDQYFTHCEHDELFLCVEYDRVSLPDRARLDELGFSRSPDGLLHSYRHGSC